MGGVAKWVVLMAVGALGARSVTDGVSNVADSAGDNVQKITPVLVVGVGAAAMVGAAYIYSQKA